MTPETAEDRRQKKPRSCGKDANDDADDVSDCGDGDDNDVVGCASDGDDKKGDGDEEEQECKTQTHVKTKRDQEVHDDGTLGDLGPRICEVDPYDDEGALDKVRMLPPMATVEQC